MEAIILAGGYGERLKGLAGDVPKPMASINDIPFLDYLLRYLLKNNIKKVVFSVFYKYKVIKKYFSNSFKEIEIDYSIDEIKLGTGGAIKHSLALTNEENILIINGDTFFDIDIAKFYKTHLINNNDVTLSLKPMKNFDRYGFVETADNGEVLSFKKKQFCKKGKIDGGIYLIKKNIFSNNKNSKVFSFNDFLIKNLNTLKVGSSLFDDLFIDIGTPEDFNKAQRIFKQKL
jgi:D-glycero-alpha-D-manno-heptose 1-phosphate guanylyltransferase